MAVYRYANIECIYIYIFLFIVPQVVEKFSEELHDMYKINRKKAQQEDWPPYQPISIVNVTVIHYRSKQT